MLFRISLTFWDELAHIAFQHVEKGQQIYVSGRLVSDTVESEDGKQQTYYKVIYLGFLIYINQTWSPVLQIVFPKPIMIVLDLLQVVVQQLNFVERSISSLPLYDRDSNSMMAGKTHSKIEKSFLVFECSWYLLSIFFAGKKLGNNAASDMSIEELWQAFFANPVDWWDNRKNKVCNYET